MVYIITRDKKERRELHIADNPNSRETLKIGREIIRAQRGGYNQYMVQKEFAADAGKVCERKKEPSTWIKEAAHEIVDKLKAKAVE